MPNISVSPRYQVRSSYIRKGFFCVIDTQNPRKGEVFYHLNEEECKRQARIMNDKPMKQ